MALRVSWEIEASEDGNTLRVSYPNLLEDALRDVYRALTSAREEAYRQALIGLGWRPPGSPTCRCDAALKQQGEQS